MGAKNISGTLRSVTIGGVLFQPAGDVNANMPTSAWEIENVPTSGTNMRKMTRRSQTIEGVVLIVNADEHQVVKAFAESLDDVTLAVATQAGDVYRAGGTVHLESYESEELRLTVHLLPRAGWDKSTAEIS